MSVLTAIKNAEHSFAGWVEKAWAKIYGLAPTLEQVAATTLKYVGPALQMVVTAEVGAPAGAVVGSVIGEVQSDLLAASSLIHDFGASPTLSSIFSGVNADLSSLLTAGHIKSPVAITAINRVITEIEVLAAAFEKAVSGAKAVVAAPAAVVAPAVTPRA